MIVACLSCGVELVDPDPAALWSFFREHTNSGGVSLGELNRRYLAGEITSHEYDTAKHDAATTPAHCVTIDLGETA